MKTTDLNTARYVNDPDFPYTYVITDSAHIYKTMRKADENSIFSDLRTAQVHLLPRFADTAQKHQQWMHLSQDKVAMEQKLQKDADQFVKQFSMRAEDVKSDESYIVQSVTSPDAIVPVVYEAIHALKLNVGSFKTVKIKKNNLVIFRKSEGYVAGFEDDPDGVYLLYREFNFVMFFKGIENPEKLTKHSYQFLSVLEKALKPADSYETTN